MNYLNPHTHDLESARAVDGPQCAGVASCTEPATWLRIVPGSQNQEWYCSAHYGRYMGMPGRWLGPADPKPAPVSPNMAALNAIMKAIDNAQTVMGGLWAIQLRRPLAEIRSIRDAVRDHEVGAR